MHVIGEKKEIVMAYCPICKKTLLIPINFEQFGQIRVGGLNKHTYVHDGPKGEESHALVMLLDENKVVRRAEISDMCLETSQCPADFKVTAYCQTCQQNLEIPIGNFEFESALKKKGFYNQIYIHGGNPHALLILIDKEKNVRRAEITNMDIATPIESVIVTPPKERMDYTLLGVQIIPEFSELFDGFFIFDRRLKTAIGFFSKEEEYSVSEIVNRMEEDIKKLSDLALMLSFQVKDKNYVYLMTANSEVCLVGIELNKKIFHWLQLLLDILGKEEETPNTIGVEILLRMLRRNLTPPKELVLQDLLFSPLYSVRFTFKYERIFERVLDRLEGQFSNTATLFRPCAEGKCTLLEVLNTETGLQYFEEFISLIAFVERRDLF
ncbi:MAG: hypothetical protein ACFFBD_15630 [Candidatus Hodarchaeota archaeon]